ncbi:MAG: hypothetical protein V7K32_07700 [Nostoc sp.]
MLSKVAMGIRHGALVINSFPSSPSSPFSYWLRSLKVLVVVHSSP